MVIGYSCKQMGIIAEATNIRDLRWAWPTLSLLLLCPLWLNASSAGALQGDDVLSTNALATNIPSTNLSPVDFSPAESPNTIAALPTTVQVEDPYILGAGDRIQVTVFQLPQYSGEFEVLVEGTIVLPVVGAVFVDGLTIDQAIDQIYSKYSQILQDPQISVAVLARRTMEIAIAGEVNSPGPYFIPTQEAAYPTLTQVLVLAGGIRMSADISQVQILRQQASGTRTITINLLQLLQSGDLSTDITLRDGDRITVPTTESPDLATLAALNTANFAAAETEPINIAVVGEVFRPGSHVVTGSAQTGNAGETGQFQNTGQAPTVTRAIQVAGGIKPLADVRTIQVSRPTRSGTTQLIAVNLWDLLQKGDLTQDLVLQDGDTVIVPTAAEIISEDATELASASFSPDSIRVNVVGEVEKPGVVAVAPNTPLNQGLFAAGGFTTRARRRSVQLIRLNPNGTVSYRTISIDFSEGINEANNPALQNDDIILVGRSAITRLSDTLATIGEPVGRFVNLVTTPFTILRLLR